MNINEPLYPHLLEILAHPASRHLILAGGFGLRLKRAHLVRLVQQGEIRTLLTELPEARATTDLDLFLKLEAFVNPEGAQAVRAMLDALRYTVKPGREHWKFARPLDGNPSGMEVHLDLLTRHPDPSESPHVRADIRRVRTRGSHILLHGRTTPEAFAVEDSTLQLPLHVTHDGGSHVASVPHPFSWVCMKTIAARDWWSRRGTSDARRASEKHPFDVFLIVAMLTEPELDQCVALRRSHERHQLLPVIRQAADSLFGTPTSPGFVQASQIAGRRLEHAAFREAYFQMLGA